MERVKKCGIAVTLISLCTLVYAAYALTTTLIVSNSGKVSILVAYWDSACTNRTVNIPWGDSIAPNSTITRSVWVKNHGGIAVNMTMLPGSWNPSNAPDYMKVSWNRESYNLTAGFVVECIFTLQVYANITASSIGSFSFDTVITGMW